jgi:hypothetical protein
MFKQSNVSSTLSGRAIEMNLESALLSPSQIHNKSFILFAVEAQSALANSHIYHNVTCLVEGCRYYATLLSVLGNRKFGYFLGYARHPGPVVLHGN